MKKEEKTIKAWAGIVEDKIDKTIEKFDNRKIYAIYPSKKSAPYQKVVRVEIKFLDKL